MTREPTPWERLDGVKHSLNFISVALDSIIEGAVEWEKSRIIKLLEGYLAPEGTASPCWRTENDVAVEIIALIKGEQK